jgi:carbonyl reductase 1
MMDSKKVIIVTGANKGIGFALVRGLCQIFQETAYVYLTARDEIRGKEAVARLNQANLHPEIHLLDIASDQSVADFQMFIKAKHGYVDVLIQNAGYPIPPGNSSVEEATILINTNNYGTYRMLKAFQPLLRENARVIVVASGYGTLFSLPEQVHAYFDVENMTMEQINQSMEAYIRAIKNGTVKEQGWVEWANIPSKVGQVALTKVFAREIKPQLGNISVNAACPGWTVTDTTRPYLEQSPNVKALSPDEAAKDVIWLALENTEFYGKLVQYRKVIPFSKSEKNL